MLSLTRVNAVGFCNANGCDNLIILIFPGFVVQFALLQFVRSISVKLHLDAKEDGIHGLHRSSRLFLSDGVKVDSSPENIRDKSFVVRNDFMGQQTSDLSSTYNPGSTKTHRYKSTFDKLTFSEKFPSFSVL